MQLAEMEYKERRRRLRWPKVHPVSPATV